MKTAAVLSTITLAALFSPIAQRVHAQSSGALPAPLITAEEAAEKVPSPFSNFIKNLSNIAVADSLRLNRASIDPKSWFLKATGIPFEEGWRVVKNFFEKIFDFLVWLFTSILSFLKWLWHLVF